MDWFGFRLSLGKEKVKIQLACDDDSTVQWTNVQV